MGRPRLSGANSHPLAACSRGSARKYSYSPQGEHLSRRMYAGWSCKPVAGGMQTCHQGWVRPAVVPGPSPLRLSPPPTSPPVDGGYSTLFSLPASTPAAVAIGTRTPPRGKKGRGGKRAAASAAEPEGRASRLAGVRAPPSPPTELMCFLPHSPPPAVRVAELSLLDVLDGGAVGISGWGHRGRSCRQRIAVGHLPAGAPRGGCGCGVGLWGGRGAGGSRVGGRSCGARRGGY